MTELPSFFSKIHSRLSLSHEQVRNGVCVTVIHSDCLESMRAINQRVISPQWIRKWQNSNLEKYKCLSTCFFTVLVKWHVQCGFDDTINIRSWTMHNLKAGNETAKCISLTRGQCSKLYFKYVVSVISCYKCTWMSLKVPDSAIGYKCFNANASWRLHLIFECLLFLYEYYTSSFISWHGMICSRNITFIFEK